MLFFLSNIRQEFGEKVIEDAKKIQHTFHDSIKALKTSVPIVRHNISHIPAEQKFQNFPKKQSHDSPRNLRIIPASQTFNPSPSERTDFQDWFTFTID
jgi:hypothetical protein